MSNVENRPSRGIEFARILGRASADLQNFGNRVGETLSSINPLATNNFTLSDRLHEKTRSTLQRAVERSHLPEDIQVVSPTDLDGDLPSQGFIVITMHPSVEEAVKAYTRGALRYITMTWNEDQLLEQLDR